MDSDVHGLSCRAVSDDAGLPRRGLERNLLLFVGPVYVVTVDNCLVIEVVEEHILVCPTDEHTFADTKTQQRWMVLEELLYSATNGTWRSIDEVCDYPKYTSERVVSEELRRLSPVSVR